MGIDLAGLVRKTTELELCGREFRFSELTLADFAQFRAWILEKRDAAKQKKREQILKDAKAIEGIDPERLLAALDKPLSDNEVEAEMETVEGVGYLAYLSLKHSIAEIKLDEVMQIIGVQDLEKITAAMFPTEGVTKKNSASTRRKAKR